MFDPRITLVQVREKYAAAKLKPKLKRPHVIGLDSPMPSPQALATTTSMYRGDGGLGKTRLPRGFDLLPNTRN